MTLTTNILFFAIILLAVPGYTLEHTFSWNSSNPAFRTSRKPTIDARMGDVVRFVCPENDGTGSGDEYLSVFEVGELAFEECQIETTSREILRCGPESLTDRMLRSPVLVESRKTGNGMPKNVAQFIRQLNPVPNGKEFRVGETYFYITTSTGKKDGMDKQTRGLCESSNMRLALKVYPAPASTQQLPQIITKPSRVDRQFEPIPRPGKFGEDLNEEEEEEDSENDSVGHLLPRDLERKESTMSPKFRRPSQFEAAGVHEQQLLKVAKMAAEGKTGTFGNTREIERNVEGGAWDPVNVEFVSEIMENSHHNADLTYQREPDFEIHEENVRTMEYSSSSNGLSISFILILSIMCFALLL